MSPPPTPDLEETIASGALALHVEHFRPRGPVRSNLVTVHGFSAHCGLYRHVGAALAGRGIAVTAFDCRGHGRSQGRRGYVARFTDFADDLDLVIERVKTLVPGVPIDLMGHSHGATVLLDRLLRGAAMPRRLVLLCPWLELRMPVPFWKPLAARALQYLWPTLTQPNEIRAADVSREPQVVAGFDSDPLVHHVATPRWFMEVRRAQRRIRAAAPRLGVPTLLVVAGDDRIVSTEASLAFARAAGASVEVRLYEGMYHEVLLEPERARVIEDIASWLSRPITGAAAEALSASDRP